MKKVLRGIWEQVLEPDDEQWELIWAGSQSLINGGTFNILNVQPGRPTRYTFSSGLTAESGCDEETEGTQIVIPAGENKTGADTMLTGNASFYLGGDWAGIYAEIFIAAPGSLKALVEKWDSDGCFTSDRINLYGTLTLTKIEQL